MCCGCYEEAGWPRHHSARVIEAAALASKCDDYGGLHILLADWNTEEHHLSWLKGQALDDDERAVLDHFRLLRNSERVSALAMRDGYLNADGTYSKVALDSGAP